MTEEVCAEVMTNLESCLRNNDQDTLKCKEFMDRVMQCQENNANREPSLIDNKE